MILLSFLRLNMLFFHANLAQCLKCDFLMIVRNFLKLSSIYHMIQLFLAILTWIQLNTIVNIKYANQLSGFKPTQHVKVLTNIHGGILDHYINPDSLVVDKVVINDCLSDHMVKKVSLAIQMDSINLDNFITV